MFALVQSDKYSILLYKTVKTLSNQYWLRKNLNVQYEWMNLYFPMAVELFRSNDIQCFFCPAYNAYKWTLIFRHYVVKGVA